MRYMLGCNLVGNLRHRLEFLAEDLDCEIAARAGQKLVEAQLNRLREFEHVTGQCTDRFFDLLLQLGLRQVRIRPLLLRFEKHECIR